MRILAYEQRDLEPVPPEDPSHVWVKDWCDRLGRKLLAMHRHKGTGNWVLSLGPARDAFPGVVAGPPPPKALPPDVERMVRAARGEQKKPARRRR